MGHHVHCSDAQHGAVHIEAVEHMIHIVFFVGPVKQNFLLPFFCQKLTDRHQKAGGSEGGITNYVVRLGFHQLHHHADDLARCAELSVAACGGNFIQQIFINIPANVRGIRLIHLFIDGVHGGDDLIQQQRRRHLENGVPHIFGIRAFLVPVQILDKRENQILHGAVHLRRGKIVKDAPFQLCAVDGLLSDLHFFCKNALIGHSEYGVFHCPGIIRFIQIVNKHQVCHLLDHVQRICQAAGPEDFPETVYFVFQFPSDHCRSLSLFRVLMLSYENNYSPEKRKIQPLWFFRCLAIRQKTIAEELAGNECEAMPGEQKRDGAKPSP